MSVNSFSFLDEKKSPGFWTDDFICAPDLPDSFVHKQALHWQARKEEEIIFKPPLPSYLSFCNNTTFFLLFVFLLFALKKEFLKIC